MQRQLALKLLIVLLLIGSTAGAYPIDSTVVATLNRRILPVTVPSASPTLFPDEVSNYTKNG